MTTAGPPPGHGAPPGPPGFGPGYGPPPAKRSSSTVVVVVLLVVVVLACLVAGPLLFFGRIFTGAVTSGGPENESVPVQEDPGFTAAGDRAAYLVRVRFAEVTPAGTEGLVEVTTTRDVANGPAVFLVSQEPGQPGVVSVGVGERESTSSGSSTSSYRASTSLRGFAACGGCEKRFVLSAVAGASTDLLLEIGATATGYDAEVAKARPTVSVERLPIERRPPATPRLALPGADAVGQVARAHHLTVEGDPARLAETRAVLRTPAPSANANRTPTPGLYRARPGGDPVVAVPTDAPVSLTPPTSCGSPCRIGLWVLLPEGGDAGVDLEGAGASSVEVVTDPVRASATEEAFAVRDGTRRTVVVDRVEGGAVDGFLVVGQKTRGGPLVRTQVGEQRGEVPPGARPLLMTPGSPCADDRCAQSVPVRFDPAGANELTLAAEAYSVDLDQTRERALLVPSIGGG